MNIDRLHKVKSTYQGEQLEGLEMSSLVSSPIYANNGYLFVKGKDEGVFYGIEVSKEDLDLLTKYGIR